MKALVLGETGGMGQGVARDLIKQEQIREIILGEILADSDRLQEKLPPSMVPSWSLMKSEPVSGSGWVERRNFMESSRT